MTKGIIYNAQTGSVEVVDVTDEEIVGVGPIHPAPPTLEERLKALELLMLEQLFGGVPV